MRCGVDILANSSEDDGRDDNKALFFHVTREVLRNLFPSSKINPHNSNRTEFLLQKIQSNSRLVSFLLCNQLLCFFTLGACMPCPLCNFLFRGEQPRYSP